MESKLSSKKIRIHPIVKTIIALGLCGLIGYLGAINGAAVLYGVMSLPFVVLYFIFLFRNPKIGIYTALTLGFIIPILGRYTNIPIPFGLGIDITLVLTYIVLFLKHWKYLNFKLASNTMVLLLSMWMGYILIQVANPEAHSVAAWFYTMRGMGLYQFLIIPLGLVLFDSKKDWYNFFNFWLGFSLLAMFWALKQSIFGVSAAEQRWLDNGAEVTHILFGKLRIFSYYFDAGTFGAAMGQMSIVCLILFLGPFSIKRKALYLFAGLFAFYALMLSGTRGALAVPGIGGILYLIMIRNTKLIVAGTTVLVLSFSFLKFTTIMQSNDQVRRLRTALNPEDASLHVRIVNRARLTEYLKGKPFGGGLGSTGAWGQRFSPHTWLANFPPDGLYTRIRAETGLIGRLFYVGMWLFILVKGIAIMWKLKNKEYQCISMAFLAGYAGILMANYGNEVMTQFPISLITFLGLSFMINIQYWDENGKIVLPDGETPVGGAYQADSRWKKELPEETEVDT